jgi:three-Cys-motif partner protein
MKGAPDILDDGLPLPVIGIWAERKYSLVAYYASLFGSSMKDKWDARVYIDLFSGAGYAKIKNTRRIVRGSPMLAIDIPDPFDKYILCEIDPKWLGALKQRVSLSFPQLNVEYIDGDVNARVTSILRSIPTPSKRFTVLSFCFVDPFNLECLQFNTIRQLSMMYMDFLVLIPAYMDAHRNLSNYIEQSSDKVEKFLGLADWRLQWANAQSTSQKFGTFITDQFGEQMKTLGYHFDGVKETILIKNPENNSPLYRLAFFSRNPLGIQFWRDARKGTRRQPRLFED